MKTLLESATAPGDSMTAPLSVVLREHKVGDKTEYVVHYHNHQDKGYHNGHYTGNASEALKVFRERIVYRGITSLKGN